MVKSPLRSKPKELNSEKKMLKQVQSDSQLEIQFKLELADKTLVESTRPGENFCFRMGDGTFLPALEELLMGLEEGTQGIFHLQPEQAFGLSDEQNIQTLSRSEFPDNMPLQEGHVIGFNTPTGDEIPGTIVSVSDETVEVDFNHPLAGLPLIFDVTVVKII